MPLIDSCRIPLVIALIGVLTLAARAGENTGSDEAVPSLTPQTVARLSGLDSQTLDAAGVSAAKQQEIGQWVAAFFQRQRPRLMTHRALWSEMLERRRNLASSAQHHVFDPCRFVTDEALEKASSRVRSARDRFRAACRKANAKARELVNDAQFRLIQSAGDNPGLPTPYRWLKLTDAEKKHVSRVLKVYQARRQLATKYPLNAQPPQLKEKVSEQAEARTIAKLLPPAKRQRLTTLRQRLNQAAPATTSQPTEEP